MDRQMTDSGRRLEAQVAGVMQLLDNIQSDLAAVKGCPEFAEALAALEQRKVALGEIVGALEQGQLALQERLEAYVAELREREAALDANRSRLRNLTRRLVQVQEDERRALARDLHDSSSGALTAIGLGLAVLKRESCLSATTLDRIDVLQQAAVAVSEELHRLSTNLRPSSLDRYGLVPAVEELVASLRKQAGVEMDFRVEGLDGRLPGDAEIALYRIIQEACTNIARYSAAAHASIIIRRQGDTVQVRVQDDGQGFDLEEALNRGRLGLVGMRERSEMLGGVFTIDTSPGCGTSLLVEAPVVEGNDRSAAPGDPARTVAPVDPEVSSQAAELARIKVLSDAMVDITEKIPQLQSVHQALDLVLARASAAIGCDYAVIARRAGSRWRIMLAYGLPEYVKGQRLLAAAVPLADEVERTQEVVVLNDAQAAGPLAVAARDSGVFSGAGLPLMIEGTFLGAVAFVHNLAPVTFKPSEVTFLRHLCSVISLVLEIIQLRAEHRERVL